MNAPDARFWRDFTTHARQGQIDRGKGEKDNKDSKDSKDGKDDKDDKDDKDIGDSEGYQGR